MPRLSSLLSLLVVVAVGGCASSSTPDASGASTESPTSVRDGVFTLAQAERGREVFGASCSACHGTREFRGPRFLLAWGGRSVGGFVDRIAASMPEDEPGSLPTRDYLDVTAYILSLNDFPPGAVELPDAPEVLERIRIERESGGTP